MLPVVGTMLFHCSRPPPLQHLAAQLDPRRVGTEVNFTVGDGRYYGGGLQRPAGDGQELLCGAAGRPALEVGELAQRRPVATCWSRIGSDTAFSVAPCRSPRVPASSGPKF